MSQNNDSEEESVVELIEHMAARIEGYSMDLHRRIDYLDNDISELRSRVEQLISELEAIIGEEI